MAQRIVCKQEDGMSEAKIALVTGANRGLGLETCRQLAGQGVRVILTCRDEAKGEAAAQGLREAGGDVRFHLLNVTDEASIAALADYVVKEFGRVDILVNNAGIFPDPFPGRDPGSNSIFDTPLETIRTAMETNTLAPLRMCQTFIPLMKGSGRVVNVSSGMGQLSEMNGCCPGYRLSKTSVNAMTRIFAEELGAASGVKINACCPGWVRTDMGGANADRSLAEGVKGIVMLALLADDGPSGGFFRDGKPIPW
jgi:NAD(P)-dependent dehydrogenase (short-subunit alcohol dehydrogenase family)